MSSVKRGARGPARPTVTIAVLGVVLAAAAWITYQVRHASVSPDDASAHEAALKEDFWQRPGARTLGSETMQKMPDVSTPTARSLAAIDDAAQALARPHNLQTDGNGHLRINRALRNELDARIGRVDGSITAEATEHARQTLRQELQGTALTDALAALERYVAYRNAEQALASTAPTLPPNLGALGDVVQLQRQMALRTQMLDAEMRTAFFGDEEALNRYRLTLLQLQSMPSLSEAERDAQLTPLWQQLPASLRAQVPAPGTAGGAAVMPAP